MRSAGTRPPIPQTFRGAFDWGKRLGEHHVYVRSKARWSQNCGQLRQELREIVRRPEDWKPRRIENQKDRRAPRPAGKNIDIANRTLGRMGR